MSYTFPEELRFGSLLSWSLKMKTGEHGSGARGSGLQARGILLLFETDSELFRSELQLQGSNFELAWSSGVQCSTLQTF